MLTPLLAKQVRLLSLLAGPEVCLEYADKGARSAKLADPASNQPIGADLDSLVS